MSKLTKQSKQLAYYLRHCPQDIGLSIDSEGWVAVSELLAKWPEKALKLDDLRMIVATDDKGRYTFNADMSAVRAVQGHSNTEVDIKFEEVKPPSVLYHGTATRFRTSIIEQGLKPQTRQYVHLTADKQVALDTGARHGEPALFGVRAHLMYLHGIKFYRAENDVYLVENVPPKYLEVY